MSVLDFIRKERAAGASVTQIFADGIDELRQNTDQRAKPPHIQSQLELVTDWFDTEEERWLLFLDAARYDVFDQLVWDYFDGELQRCWNGGVGYTGDWTVRHLSQDFGNRGLFSWVPLRGFGAAEYDGRMWFAQSPDIQAELDVQEQLAALGYGERQTDTEMHISPEKVNRAVREHKNSLNGGVVRYLKPHPPFEGLPEITSESSKTADTWRALNSGELTLSELSAAYRETFQIGLRAAQDLVQDLDGEVVITADHGSCLGDCGQLYHGRRLEMHDHLTTVPWFRVER